MDVEAEHMWKWVDKIKTFDLQKGAEGADLDELNAHRFLEVSERFFKFLCSSYLSITAILF